MLQSRQILTILAVPACALVLAACGGGAEAPPAQPAPTPAADPNALPTGGGGVCDPVTNPAACGDDPLDSGAQAPLPEGDGHNVDGGLGGLDGVSDVFGALADFQESADTGMYGSELSSGGMTTGTGSTGSGGSGSGSSSTTKVTYGPAKISLDGEVYTVSKGTIFPTTSQLFEVTRIGSTSVDIDLVAGEFSSGSTGVTLYKGKSAQLVNDSEGITYILKLIKVTANSTTTYADGSTCGIYSC